MLSNTATVIRSPNTEVPECPITKEKVTEITDPVMFPDGRIYSEKALDAAHAVKGIAYSPIFNQEIKQNQYKCTGKYALQELVTYTKELETCFSELKDKYEKLVTKNQEETLIKSYLPEDKKEEIILKIPDIIQQTAFAIHDQQQHHVAITIQRNFYRKKIIHLIDQYQKEIQPLYHKKSLENKLHTEESKKYQDSCIAAIKDGKIITEAKHSEDFQVTLKHWKNSENEFKKNQKKLQLKLKKIDQKFNPLILIPYKKWLMLNQKKILKNKEISDLIKIQIRNIKTESEQNEQRLLKTLSVFAETKNSKNNIKNKMFLNTKEYEMKFDDRDIHGFSPFSQKSLDDWLFTAVRANKPYRIQKLLLANANIHAHDSPYNGDTPLHVAIYRNHFEAAEILLKNGAKTLEKNKSGKIPRDEFGKIVWLNFNKDFRILKLLEDHERKLIFNKYQIEIDTKEIKKLESYQQKKIDDLLFEEIVNNRPYAIQHLLHVKANIHLVDDIKGTPLDFAIRNNCFESAKILLENGANPLLIAFNKGFPRHEFGNGIGCVPTDNRILPLLDEYESKWQHQQTPSHEFKKIHN